MTEVKRYHFLVRRDGTQAAKQWMREAAERYRVSMVQALFLEWKGGAKGVEWATIYCQAARECDYFGEQA